MNVNVQLGMRIRYLRRKAHLSIEDLALNASINKNYLSDLERGRRNPTVALLDRLVIALNITLEELFRGISSIK